MRRQIVVNGRTYERVEDMPPDVRALYEQTMAGFQDANGNGVPDIMEGMAPGRGPANVTVDQQVYTSLDQMPPEARQLFQQAMGQLGGALPPGAPPPSDFGQQSQWGANPDQQGQWGAPQQNQWGSAAEWGAKDADMRWRSSDGSNPYANNPYQSAVGPTHGASSGKMLLIALVALALTAAAVALLVVLMAG